MANRIDNVPEAPRVQRPEEDSVERPAKRISGAGLSVDFGKSVVRLTGREWLFAGLALAVCFIGAPWAWERHEPREREPDHRMPYALSEDYWSYRRLIAQAVSSDRIPVIGDSFVWGEYVSPNGTLSHCLNQATGTQAFANAGLNGAHPLALEGLIRYETNSLAQHKIILHCNPLWLSSPERDLQSETEGTFNHPHLVPQFYPRIPSYKAPLSKRLGVVVDRAVPFFRLVDHMRFVCFDGRDLHSWSIANPYANPLAQLDRIAARTPSEESHPEQMSWRKRRIPLQDFPWVDLGTSLQWSAWRRAAAHLHSRGTLFVVLGPLNEHLLTPSSRQRYQSDKDKIETWLRSERIPFAAPALLPSEEYADASHPLRNGYARIALELAKDRAFQQWFEAH